jgi:aspartyl-tRNA(Asn)/glutamyl-tRNA(Gln) amidotransferase subunit C
MMLDPSEVENIAHLARLSIDAADRDSYARNLSAILAFVEQLNSIDTSGVLPMAHPLDTPQRLRPDEVTETNQRDQFQAHAPKVEAGLYLVPKVIE